LALNRQPPLARVAKLVDDVQDAQMPRRTGVRERPTCRMHKCREGQESESGRKGRHSPHPWH